MRSSSRLRMLGNIIVAIVVLTLVIGATASTASAEEKPRGFGFEEQSVEFHNQDIKLVGSLLLPKSDRPVPAVVFVHGAGRQTRESYREAGSYFASRGIAALIYDKRGTGGSSGAYESFEPYTNLVNDALSAIALLKEQPAIDASKIGIWGLSQGAHISAAAASKSKDIQFITVVGADVADGMLFYYRDNLFRRYSLSSKLRDMAEKMHIVQEDLYRTSQDGLRPSLFVPRTYSSPDQYVHPAWSHVQQPVLAMWGQLDQNVLVRESVAGLKNSLAQANNQKWTMMIVPGTNHDLKLSETGAIQSETHGYPQGALQTMTGWAWNAIDRPLEINQMKQDGVATNPEILPRLSSYQRLRWFGNGVVQAIMWILFLICFSASTMAILWRLLTRLFRRQQSDSESATSNAVKLKRAIDLLNLVILVALSIIVLLVLDQIHPSCPALLQFTPLLGTISTIATLALVIILFRTSRDRSWSVARRLRIALDVSCLILFVPFMYYWNLIGFRF